MNGLKISLDSERYSTRPCGNEVGRINNRLGKSVIEINKDDIKQYATAIATEGLTFCPATFKDSRSNDNFEQLQLLVLDFDGKISFQEVQDRSQQYGLPMLFAYDTFSSVNHDRFRVAYLSDTSLPDKKSAEIHLSALAAIFPEVDECSKKVSQMYFGSNKQDLIYFDDSIPEINTESLIRNMTTYLRDKHGDTHYKKKIAEFARTHSIALNNRNLLDVSLVSTPTEEDGAFETITNQDGKFLPNSIILNKPTSGKKLPNISYVINLVPNRTSNTSVEGAIGTKAPRQRTPHRSSMLDDIGDSCRLYMDFIGGDRKLDQNELFGLATNIIQVESGSKHFRDVLDRYPALYSHKYKYWDYNLRYMNQNEYKPMSCSNYCPYKDTCQHSSNIITTAKPQVGTMERVAGYTEVFYPLEECEADLDEKIRAAIGADDTKVHVIKAQTALEKTHTYLNFMKTTTARCLIAVPTNVLKDDVYNRAVAEEIEVFKTSSLDDENVKNDTPADIRRTIDYLYKTGQHQLIDAYISKVAKERGIECLQNHLKEKRKFETCGGHVITTHRKLLSMDEKILKKFDVIIIDEDIVLKSVIPNQVSITVSDLRKLIKTMDKEVRRGSITLRMYRRLYKKVLGVLKAIETKTLFTLDSFDWEAEADPDKIKKEPTGVVTLGKKSE